jgi:hypothetical protein
MASNPSRTPISPPTREDSDLRLARILDSKYPVLSVRNIFKKLLARLPIMGGLVCGNLLFGLLVGDVNVAKAAFIGIFAGLMFVVGDLIVQGKRRSTR